MYRQKKNGNLFKSDKSKQRLPGGLTTPSSQSGNSESAMLFG